MIKKKLTLSVDDELLTMAKRSGLNISEFLEKKLAEHFKVRCVLEKRIVSLWEDIP